jgi:U6 snRNA-associated Sm-like protein LSm7
VGTLKGYDQLINIVLDDTIEYRRSSDDAGAPAVSAETRNIGLIVCRGPQITVLSPDDGFTEIENPFVEDAAAE